MKKLSNKLGRSAIAILVLAMLASVSVAASVYFPRYAGMKVFSGRIEDFGATTNVFGRSTPRLVLSTENGTGVEGDVTNGDVVFPIVSEISRDTQTDEWITPDGRKAVQAPTFTLTANEAIEQVYMRIEVSGDLSAAKALNFGVTNTCYWASSEHEGWDRSDGHIVEIGADGCSEPILIGDLLPGDKVEIDVAGWVMAHDLTEYDGGNFTVEVVFSAMEE